MKHKPILFKKMEVNPGKARDVIGLVGTHHGVGVTYTGLMLAFYMGETIGKKTAYMECNQHHDMELIQNAYEWSNEKPYSFSYRLITCYREVTSKTISDILGEDYDCFVLDFGTDFNVNREEFLRCGTKIVIGGRSEWDLLKLEAFKETAKTIRGSESWLYFIPQARDKTVKRIKSEFVRKVWAVPANENPAIPTKDTNRFFSSIFRV